MIRLRLRTGEVVPLVLPAKGVKMAVELSRLQALLVAFRSAIGVSRRRTARSSSIFSISVRAFIAPGGRPPRWWPGVKRVSLPPDMASLLARPN
jgi:hypothetical protein